METMKQKLMLWIIAALLCVAGAMAVVTPAGNNLPLANSASDPTCVGQYIFYNESTPAPLYYINVSANSGRGELGLYNYSNLAPLGNSTLLLRHAYFNGVMLYPQTTYIVLACKNTSTFVYTNAASPITSGKTVFNGTCYGFSCSSGTVNMYEIQGWAYNKTANVTLTVNMLNSFDNGTIPSYSIVVYNSTMSVTGSSSVSVPLGTYEINVTIPGFLQNQTHHTVNVVGDTTYTNYSLQSLFNVTVTEAITGNVLSGFNASTSKSFNTTAGSSVLLVTNNTAQAVTVTKAGYLPASASFTASTGTITPVNLTLGSFILTINASENQSGALITNFTIILNNSVYSYSITSNTTSGKLNFTLIGGNYSIFINASGYAYATRNISLTNASYYPNETFHLFQTNSFSINFRDEITMATINNVSLDLISGLYANNYSTTNGTLFLALLTPENYTMRYQSNGYNQRFYFVTLEDRDNQQITLYLLQNTSSDDITVNLLDQNNNKVQGATIYAYRYDLTTNSYKLVEMAMTNSEGQTMMHLQLNFEFYKFVIVYNGEVVFTSSPSYLTSNILNFQIVIGEQFGTDEYAYVSSTGNVDFNNVTDTFSFDFLTPSATRGCLKVYKTSFGRRSLLGSQCIEAISGSTAINITRQNDTTFSGYGYVYFNNVEVLIDSASHTFVSTPTIADDEALFWMIFIHFILLGIFLFDPTLALLTQAIPPILFRIANFISIGWDVIIAWACFWLVIAFIVMRNSK